MARCLKCEKDLDFIKFTEDVIHGENSNNSTPIDNAGFIEVSFHYGSRHDQMKGWHDKSVSRLDTSTPLKKILASDRIQGYICDGCFEEHIDLFEGWRIERETKQTRLI
jgi:hypothetical protein